MKIYIDDVSKFTNILGSLKPVISEEVFLHFEENMLKVQQMDLSHIFLVTLELGKNFFEGYEYDDIGDVCVPLRDLENTLSSFSKFKRVVMEINDSDISFYGEKGNVKKNPKIARINEDSEYISQAPTVEFPFIAKMKTSTLKNVIDDMLLLKDNQYVIIEKKDNILNFREKNTNGEANVDLVLGEDMIPILSDDFIHRYDADMMKKMLISGGKLNKDVVFSCGDEKPVMLKFAFENGYISYYLALMYV
jgi:proliferating cell nuclear antigen